jgi:hypothetical protein
MFLLPVHAYGGEQTGKTFTLPIILSCWGPEIFVIALFQTNSAYVFSSVWKTKFYTYEKITYKVILVHILIFTFLKTKLEDKTFWTKW